MSKAFLILVATALVGTGFSTRAEAAAITLNNIVVGAGTVDADIVVSGLGVAIGGYAVQVTYNPLDFSGATYANDPTNKLGDGGDPILDLSFGFGLPGPGFLDLFVISTKAPALLTALQAPFLPTFTLAHVQFTRVAGMGTDLALANLSLSDVNGIAIPLNGAVPEPASMLLVGTGLAALVARRRKQNKA